MDTRTELMSSIRYLAIYAIWIRDREADSKQWKVQSYTQTQIPSLVAYCCRCWMWFVDVPTQFAQFVWTLVSCSYPIWRDFVFRIVLVICVWYGSTCISRIYRFDVNVTVVWLIRLLLYSNICDCAIANCYFVSAAPCVLHICFLFFVFVVVGRKSHFK